MFRLTTIWKTIRRIKQQNCQLKANCSIARYLLFRQQQFLYKITGKISKIFLVNHPLTDQCNLCSTAVYSAVRWPSPGIHCTPTCRGNTAASPRRTCLCCRCPPDSILNSPASAYNSEYFVYYTKILFIIS